MNGDDEIDCETELARQAWWFRLLWRFKEWRRLRRLAAIAPAPPGKEER